MKNLARVQKVKKQSFRVSLLVHASLLALGFLPFAAQQLDRQEDKMVVIPIQFAEFASQSEGLQAKSEKVIEQVKPVTEEAKDVIGAETPEPTEDLVPVTEEVEVESEVVEEEPAEVEASETNENTEAEEAAAEGGFESTNVEGNAEGSSDEGDEMGSNGIDGDGIITRKIIYRKDISKATHESGKIVLNLCIDRNGQIREMKYNKEESSIYNTDIVSQAMDIVVSYRFERDENAAWRECGMLTIIFDIEDDSAEEVLAMQ